MIVRQFLEWAETAPADQRAEAAHALARAYLTSDVDDDTRNGMEAALTLLLDDPAPGVRYALADALANDPNAPRHVVASLAVDHAEIARTVLARSPLFSDGELVDIVATADDMVQIAVAARPVVSGAVVAAIAEVGGRGACRTLAANPDAAIGPASFRRLAERFGDDPALRDLLLKRSELPVDIHQMLVRQLGDSLSVLMVQKNWAPAQRARRVAREACDRATVAMAGDADAEGVVALAEHLRVSGQLTTELLLRAVCCGEIELLEGALTTLTDLPHRRVSHLVRGGRSAAFRAVYARAGLPKSAFEAFAAAIDAWRELGHQRAEQDRASFTLQMINAVLAGYAERQGGDMTELAAMLRRFAADQARDAARAYAERSAPAAAAPTTMTGTAVAA